MLKPSLPWATRTTAVLGLLLAQPASAQHDSLPPPPPPPEADEFPPPPPLPPDLATASMPGGITSPSLITHCLCEHERLEEMRARVDRALGEFRAAKRRDDALKQQMETSRATVDTTQQDQVDAYRRLVEAEETAHSELFNVALPHAQSIVPRYNGRVGDYDRTCTQNFDAEAYETVRRSLVCPRPE